MSDLEHLLFENFPEAAVLVREGTVTSANSMALHYLPQLKPGAPAPAFLLQTGAGADGAGRFFSGASSYAFRRTDTPQGTLFLFSPAPQTALTDGQLDGALRQFRILLSELLAGAEGRQGQAHFFKSFYRLFRLMDNLDFLRRASLPNELSFRPSAVNLAALCAQVTDGAAPLLREAGVELVFQCSVPSLPISGDPALLQRLLLELISNAARAAGGAPVVLRLRPLDRQAVLSLSAGSAPLTNRQLAAILQQDTDQGVPIPGAGAGLGLTIARHIAALHGGSLLVEWGGGAPTLVVSLPAAPLPSHVEVKSPTLLRDGGLSPLLVALSDVLPARVFEPEDLE